MEAIRISTHRVNGLVRYTTFRFEDDEQSHNASTHLLANSVQTDRIIFQLPGVIPPNRFFQRHPIQELVQSAPGVAMVRQINAARLFNQRGGITSIDHPERYRQPTFIAHLSNANTSTHPLAIGHFIRDMVELAYAPDAVISVLHTTPEVDALGQPTRVIGLKIDNSKL